MVKLTDRQRIVLSKAAARKDDAAVVPLRMNKAAAAKIGSSLIGRKLMREIRSKPGMPVWREDEDGRSMSLVITRAGRNAIGIDDPDETYLPASSKSSAARRADRHLAGAAPRAGSKQALVIEMLSKQQGRTDPRGRRSRHHSQHPAPECPNIAERTFRDLSPLRLSRFHTVCQGRATSAPSRPARRTRQALEVLPW
jgi:hypothetical protein